jgi:DNA-binding response OmpR family regulator
MLEQPGFTVDTKLKTVCRGKRECGLTPTEFDILMYFMNHEGQRVTAEEIYRYIWDAACYGEIRTIVVHISNLRKKIGDGEDGMRYIHNIRGVGYYYKPEAVK